MQALIRTKPSRVLPNECLLFFRTIKTASGYFAGNSYYPWLVSGKITPSEHVDASMPIHYDDGKMSTVTLPQLETHSMLEIQETVSCMRGRMGDSGQSLAHLTFL